MEYHSLMLYNIFATDNSYNFMLKDDLNDTLIFL